MATTLAVVCAAIAVALWRRRAAVDAPRPASVGTLGLWGPLGPASPPSQEKKGAAAAAVPLASRPASPKSVSDMARRLEPAARLLGAHGVVVWASSPDRRQLDIVAAHGYSDAFLSRIGPVAVDAPVLTALAFTERRARIRPRIGGRLAAIAVPVERGAETLGVLTAEIDSAAGDRVSADTEALARLLASQMAAGVAALSSPATRPVGAGADRPAVPPACAPPAVQVASGAVAATAAIDPVHSSLVEMAPAAAMREFPRALTALESPVAPPPTPHPSVESSTPVEHAMPMLAPWQEGSEAMLREARSRFISGFRKRCTSIEELIDEVEQKGPSGPLAALKHIVHRLAGLAAPVGLEGVGRQATELDRLLGSPGAAADVAGLRAVFRGMQEAFLSDLTVVPPLSAAPSGQAVGAHVLLVTDDADLAPRVAGDLRDADYRVTLAGNGRQAIELAAADRPHLILLDVELTGETDGHSVCRRVKSDPALAEIPVVLVASHASTVDRMAGFALGADDYLTKPVQTIEMLLRVRWMLTRPAAERLPPPRAGGGLLTYDAFVSAAREVLRQGTAALGLVRVRHADMSDIAALFCDDLRRKDLLGRYSDSQLVVLMPGATAGVAGRRIAGVLDIACAAGLQPACAGVTATGLSAERFLEPLLAQAESALSAAQVGGAPVGVHGAGAAAERGTILVVDDDPDVVHIIDARLKAAGLSSVVAFDGQQALHLVETRAPSVMVLELMLPKRSGFDVLARLRELPEPRPKVIVVSSRSREEDIMRAFELGADDYLTKPFNPQELLARITRLLR